MIQRRPSLLFSGLWLVWSGAYFYSVLAGLYTLRLWCFVAFFLVEGSAVIVKSGLRDTLSEIWTWIIRKLAKPTSGFGRGWNAMLLAYVLIIAYGVGDSLNHGGMPGWLSVGVGGLVAVFLSDHWTDPVRHG